MSEENKENTDHTELVDQLAKAHSNEKQKLASEWSSKTVSADTISTLRISDLKLPDTKLDFDDASIKRQLDLRTEIDSLTRSLTGHLNELSKVRSDGREKEAIIANLTNDLKELRLKEKLNYLLSRVHSDAKELLITSENFQKLFSETKECKTVVMAIDIRRSTELMLKAKNAELYAEFVTELCKKLNAVIINNYGIFDKFTGDGVIAFFPEFYSGKDMMGYCLKAASEIHECFSDHYQKSRHCFDSVLKEVGIGIGIDYGDAHFASVSMDYTIVGKPIVYACRLSGANAGDTLLNQPAFELVSERYGNLLDFDEKELKIKHEGAVLAYKVHLHFSAVQLERPIWPK